MSVRVLLLLQASAAAATAAAAPCFCWCFVSLSKFDAGAAVVSSAACVNYKHPTPTSPGNHLHEVIEPH